MSCSAPAMSYRIGLMLHLQEVRGVGIRILEMKGISELEWRFGLNGVIDGVVLDCGLARLRLQIVGRVNGTAAIEIVRHAVIAGLLPGCCGAVVKGAQIVLRLAVTGIVIRRVLLAVLAGCVIFEGVRALL